VSKIGKENQRYQTIFDVFAVLSISQEVSGSFAGFSVGICVGQQG
jgi:hypothetical protein